MDVHRTGITGVPDREVVAQARRSQADLIVMGTHGLSGVEHCLLGSVTERVVRRSEIPVLPVKQPERECVSAGQS